MNNKKEVFVAMFPEKYPANELPLDLSTKLSFKDKDMIFWQAESQNLEESFREVVLPKIKENNPADFSVFAFAPMPLLIKLGTLFTDKISVDTYQPIREPKTWSWQDEPEDFEFLISEQARYELDPVLVLSLSGPEFKKYLLRHNFASYENIPGSSPKPD